MYSLLFNSYRWPAVNQYAFAAYYNLTIFWTPQKGTLRPVHTEYGSVRRRTLTHVLACCTKYTMAHVTLQLEYPPPQPTRESGGTSWAPPPSWAEPRPKTILERFYVCQNAYVGSVFTK